MLVRRKAKACGIVLYGIVLGLVLALPGCNNTESGPWPPLGSKAEQEALCRLPGHCAHSTPMGDGIGPIMAFLDIRRRVRLHGRGTHNDQSQRLLLLLSCTVSCVSEDLNTAGCC